MRILVACEVSGIVRDAFRARGHDAISCDLSPSDRPGPHIVGDVLDAVERGGWDMMIAFPPCTYLAVSGLHWNHRRPGRAQQTELALSLVRRLMDAPIPRIAIENPVGCISTRIRKPDQIVQPWQFGHDASKKTCLWLQGLPPIRPTQLVVREGRYANQTPSGQNKLGPGPLRAKLRSETYTGIADAMADQWSEPSEIQMEIC